MSVLSSNTQKVRVLSCWTLVKALSQTDVAKVIFRFWLIHGWLRGVPTSRAIMTCASRKRIRDIFLCSYIIFLLWQWEQNVLQETSLAKKQENASFINHHLDGIDTLFHLKHFLIYHENFRCPNFKTHEITEGQKRGIYWFALISKASRNS